MKILRETSHIVSSGYPKTETRVENVMGSRVFLTKFEVFGLMMKHCLECLICIFSIKTKPEV